MPQRHDAGLEAAEGRARRAARHGGDLLETQAAPQPGDDDLALLRRPPDDVVAYLYRMVRNGALDAGKMQRRRERRESLAARSVGWFVEPAVEGLDAETAVRALEGLAAEQREVIVARLWGGLSFEQIAAVADCSASTAFRRFEAGIVALRHLLGVSCREASSTR